MFTQFHSQNVQLLEDMKTIVFHVILPNEQDGLAYATVEVEGMTGKEAFEKLVNIGRSDIPEIYIPIIKYTEETYGYGYDYTLATVGIIGGFTSGLSGNDNPFSAIRIYTPPYTTAMNTTITTHSGVRGQGGGSYATVSYIELTKAGAVKLVVTE